MNSPNVGVDSVYYEAQDKLGLVGAVIVRARRRMLDDFLAMTAAGPADTILDIGVSDVITDEANFLERRYPYRSNITCVGLGDGAAVLAAYPGIAYRQIAPDQALPFADQSFAIATCNAVLEHVGDDAHRRAMIADMLRVARRVFIAVPNRWFPVEHHTAVPLLHFWPGLFRAACRAIGKGYWADPANLEFLSPSRLVGLFPPGVAVTFRHSGIPLGPFSSNLVCVAAAAS
jgi:SAM-dependent methyltransferase